jgi:hypothetical protein
VGRREQELKHRKTNMKKLRLVKLVTSSYRKKKFAHTCRKCMPAIKNAEGTTFS